MSEIYIDEEYGTIVIKHSIDETQEEQNYVMILRKGAGNPIRDGFYVLSDNKTKDINSFIEDGSLKKVDIDASMLADIIYQAIQQLTKDLEK